MGFLNPARLAFGAALGVLLLLYLFQRVRHRVEVPSLLLWRNIPQEPMQMRRPLPDWLFWLQAALLCALVAGLARPYWSRTSEAPIPARLVLVIDTSASMQAHEGRRTRFEEAQTQALSLIDALRPGDAAMIISASNRPDVVADFTADQAALRGAVEALRPLDTGTDLTAALALAKRAYAVDPSHTEIALITDLPASAINPADRPVVRRFPVGETSDNVAISSLRVFQGAFEEPREARAYVLVRNFGYGERHGVLSLTANGDVITRTGFTVPGRGARSFVAERFSRPGLVEAAIDVDDALEADNRAYGWLQERRPLRLLVVSPSSPLVDDILQVARAVRGLSVEQRSPAAYAANADVSADVVLFHRVAPPPPANAGALYVYPPAGNEIFPVRGHAAHTDVMDWNAYHSTLYGLKPLTPFPLAAAQQLELPPGGEALLMSRTEAREFPLAVAVDAQPRRACIGFDLEAEHLLGNDSLSLLVFFLNLLDWLSPDDGAAPAIVDTGDTISLEGFPSDLPVEVHGPDGRTEIEAPGTRFVSADFVGLYDVRADGSKQAVLANFFDAAESDIGRGAKDPAPTLTARTADEGPSRMQSEFGWWMYAAAAALMWTEWAAWRRRK